MSTYSFIITNAAKQKRTVICNDAPSIADKIALAANGRAMLHTAIL